MRNRVTPVNPASDRQGAVRSGFGGWSAAYRALTDSQRTAWAVLGSQFTRVDSLGQTYSLTGLQAYVSANQNLLTLGQAAIDDAPALAIPGDSLLSGILVDTSPTDVFTVNAPAPASGLNLLIEATKPVSPGINFMPRGQYKFIKFETDGDVSPFDILAEYEALFGEIPQGSKVFVRTRLVDQATGQAGPLAYASTIAL